MSQSKFRLAAGLAVAAVLSAGTVSAADLPSPLPPPVANFGALPAVDGINGKIEAYGGDVSNISNFYGVGGSISAPLGRQFGVQFDGSLASLNNTFVASGTAHAFWRDPGQGLFGVFGQYNRWNDYGGVNLGRGGAEAALYRGQWTVEGVAGVEGGTNTTVLAFPILNTINFQTRFYDQVDVAYYPVDNLKVYAGHLYSAGLNFGRLGAEWGMPFGGGKMTSVYAEGDLGAHGNNAVVAGLRIYFGQNDKSLLQRHREDDPPLVGGANYFAGGVTGGPTIVCAGSKPTAPRNSASCPLPTQLPIK